jgi:ubiquinone/menaquinone biosynthesis C-methylase UbiE
MSCANLMKKILNDENIDGYSNENQDGTDKNIIHSYVDEIYGIYLEPFLNKEGNILEIGTRFGASAVLWNKLLPNFNVCTLDISNIITQSNVKKIDWNKVRYIVGDAYTPNVRDEIKNYYENFDIIIDDGPHTLDSHKLCLDLYLDLLKPGGHLIIEDIENLENLDVLVKKIPSGYKFKSYDLREKKGRYDDICLVITKNKKENKKAKIVMIAMFRNESKVLKRMLESCKPYVDYYVMQNNGSTDGSDEIAKQFLIENNLPGEVYDVKEGWIGFGWNRDHLIQHCQKLDHGCDWILKMDCDEVLEVDDDFDWSLLDSKDTQAFHIAAVSGTCIYYRAWMWNAKLPWRFNHDDCHETIYCAFPEIGHSYITKDLPKSFRQIGFNEGQSWGVPSKFATHALELEEKLIRENTMLTDLYHFFYIGKSYSDTYRGSFFPLKESHQKEYARRCIYYLWEYVKYVHRDTGPYDNEMSYVALIMIAEAYDFLQDYSLSITTYEYCDKFCPDRNDHLFGLATVYEKIKDYEQMYFVATIMMDPRRKNPFPRYALFIDTSMYNDGGSRVLTLYEKSRKLFESTEQSKKEFLPFIIHKNKNKRMFIVDNFYSNPDEIREFALAQEFKTDIRWYKGLRTVRPYRNEELKKAFENIIGEKIQNWDEYGHNGVFQITTSDDPQVYHHDEQKWAAMIYLTPNAPYESGTRLHTSKINGAGHKSIGKELIDQAFSVGFYDSTKFNVVDSAGNVYNRLVIMDAGCIHSAGSYFGNTPENGRLTHLFFFD